MKKIILGLLIAFTLFVWGCNDASLTESSRDKVIPVLKLKGPASVTISTGGYYKDSGATASDDTDGDISEKIIISGLPTSTAERGRYEIKYSVKDDAGNSAEDITRTLIITDTESSVNFSAAYTTLGSITSEDIEYSPDGRYIAVSAGPIHLFDSATGYLLKKFQYAALSSESSASLSFSPDGKRIAAGGYYCPNISIWDVSTGSLVTSFEAHSDTTGQVVFTVKYSPDGSRIASYGYDKKIKVWDASTFSLLLTIDEPSGRNLSFSPDGTQLTNGSKTWSVADGTLLQSFEHGGQSQQSPDGKIVATIEGDHPSNISINLWDASSNSLIGSIPVNMGIYSLEFSKDSSKIAASTLIPATETEPNKTVIKIWNVSDMSLYREFFAHYSLYCSLAFSPDGKKLTSSSIYMQSNEFNIKMWNLEGSISSKTITGNYITFNARFSNDSEKIYSLGSDGINRTLLVMDSMNGNILKNVSISESGQPTDLSHDEKMIAEIKDTKINIRNSSNGSIIKTIEIPEPATSAQHGYLRDAAFSPDDSKIYSLSSDNTVRIQDITNGDISKTIDGVAGYHKGFKFSPDGSLFVIEMDCEGERCIDIWDVASERKIRTISLGLAYLPYDEECLAFSPDSKKIAVGYMDNNVPLSLRGVAQIWDIASGEALTSVTPEDSMLVNDPATTVSFTPDGTKLVTLSAGGLKFWDSTTGNLLKMNNSIQSYNILFSPDGKKMGFIIGREIKVLSLT